MIVSPFCSPEIAVTVYVSPESYVAVRVASPVWICPVQVSSNVSAEAGLAVPIMRRTALGTQSEFEFACS